MLYGSETTWCLRESDMSILRRTERAMVRAMCAVKLMEKRKTEELMAMLGREERVIKLAKANGVRWYGHVLRKEDGHCLRRALEYEVDRRRRRGRPKRMWRSQVAEELTKVGLKKEDARWREGVRRICCRSGFDLATLVDGDKTG